MRGQQHVSAIRNTQLPLNIDACRRKLVDLIYQRHRIDDQPVVIVGRRDAAVREAGADEVANGRGVARVSTMVEEHTLQLGEDGVRPDHHDDA